MHLGKKNDKHNYIISEERQIELEETTVEKDLGIWVDNELGFKEHINKVVNKANSTLGIIRRKIPLNKLPSFEVPKFRELQVPNF